MRNKNITTKTMVSFKYKDCQYVNEYNWLLHNFRVFTLLTTSICSSYFHTPLYNQVNERCVKFIRIERGIKVLTLDLGIDVDRVIKEM
jgi:hypothetical protein